jgi:hypothetical protein
VLCYHHSFMLGKQTNNLYVDSPYHSVRPGPAFAHGTTGAKRTVGALPSVNKNLPHTWTTMRQQRYEGKAEMWSVRAMHAFSCTEISGTMLQCYVLTCGRAVIAFSAPPRSRRPRQGPRSPHPKASPGYVGWSRGLGRCDWARMFAKYTSRGNDITVFHLR